MSVTSPTSASPSTSLLAWDEAAVQSYLAHIGLAQYEDVIVGESSLDFTPMSCCSLRGGRSGHKETWADAQNMALRGMSWL